MEVAEPAPSLFQRLRAGLARTRDGLVGRIDALLAGRSTIDGDTLEALEEILIESDIGVEHAMTLIARIQEQYDKKDLKDPHFIKGYIREELTAILSRQDYHLIRPAQGPLVIMVVGVNGVGKTTTIAKLARRFSEAGESVLLAAGDTFRAAATEQLEIWGKRVGAQVIKHQSGADPSAVVFDALKAADARGSGVVIADTAGRLHTKVNLMEELKKMKRVMAKVMPEAPHEILLVLDATTGQNALSQAKIFHEAVGVTGIALTKLDGTAKGGIVTAIVGELGIPVKLIGIGEGMDDLRDFEPEAFVSALFDTQGSS
ncbi:MAG: signal recognition particle-docking protein FtsY [bacterium]|nr:signal recognition particle-docking protein FtsY [bacterium]